MRVEEDVSAALLFEVTVRRFKPATFQSQVHLLKPLRPLDAQVQQVPA